MADPRKRDDEVDPRLRAALEPRAGQAERVARAALEPRPGAVDRLLRKVFEWQPSFARRHPLRSLAGLALLIALGGWLIVLAVGLVSTREPASLRPSEPALARHSLSNRDGVIVVRRPDGGAVFLYSRERPTEPPRGMMLIVRGEIRP